MAKRDPLGVWLYGMRVAELTSNRPGEVRCRYSDDARARWALNTPVLSCSLPLSMRRARADAFFVGLLPEGQHRQAMAAQARVPSHDTLGLLARFGRDVAGAVVIGDPGDRSGDVEPYTSSTLEAEVAALRERPLGLHDDSELSIAGLQDKLLLVDLGGGRWGRPVHGRASTHILKVEDRRYPGMAELEAACLRLAAAVGLTTVEAAVETVAGLPCLIVSRFDRAVDVGGAVVRVHQEDACQALGRDPDGYRGLAKYQRAGGPAFHEIARLLDAFAVDPIAELTKLARVATFTTLIGNADAHGKNLALLHPTPETVALAPLYDTVPTALWPSLRAESAMTIGGRDRLDVVGPDDVATEARDWSLDPAVARAAAVATAAPLAELAQAASVPERLAEHLAVRSVAFLKHA